MGRPHTGPSIDTRCHHCHLMSLDGSTRLKCHCHVAAVRARLSTICHSYYYFIRPQCPGSARRCDPRPLERIITGAWDSAPGTAAQSPGCIQPQLQRCFNLSGVPHPCMMAGKMFYPLYPFRTFCFFFTNGIAIYFLAFVLHDIGTMIYSLHRQIT